MSLPEISSSALQRMIIILAIWIATGLFVRYFGRCIKVARDKSALLDIDDRTFLTLDRILDTIAIVLAISMSLSVLGVSGVLYTTLTAFGVIGIILGLAIKDLTANIFAGFMMIFNPSFLVGDYIEIDKYEGTVSKISLRMTVLKRGDGVLMAIPNAMFVIKPIINFSAATKRRVELKVGIANESDIEKAITLMKNVAQDHEKTLPSESIEVVMTDVKDYAVDITMRFWVPADDLRSSTSAVLQSITDHFRENNIDLAVPLRKYVGASVVTE